MLKNILFFLFSFLVLPINAMHDNHQLSLQLAGHLEYEEFEEATLFFDNHPNFVPSGRDLQEILRGFENLEMPSCSILFAHVIHRINDADQKGLYNFVTLFDQGLLDLYIQHRKAKQFVKSQYGKDQWEKLLLKLAEEQDQG